MKGRNSQMEQAAYCYGWLPGRPNCHPVHTLKHIGMIEDLERAHATMLCWSMMGSGSISLPFLERQIYGELPPQLRFNGYMNDKEFNEECLKRGILPYAVIYEAQGWEFPVVLNEEETEIREMNIIRSERPAKWYGLREFTQDTYPSLFPKRFADYFPEGIRNSDGEVVTDLWEECTTRDMHGNATHSHWVEVDGLTQTCHGTCRNNPVWLAYLKKIIEIQIDAGVRAIQLDESESPICSFGFGGCFCKDCMKQFREYLKRLSAEGTLPSEMSGLDLETFDYGVYLRDSQTTWPTGFMDIPFSTVFWAFSVEALNIHFQEMIDHVKRYGAASKGIDVKVSGNFTNMHLMFAPSLDKLDCCITEQRRTVFRRHNWFRMAVGYTGDKSLILAENPYNGFMPKFVELIHRGVADDYYRLFIMEAAVHGGSMAYPYGTWMGNKIRDSFSAPYKTGNQVQDFLNAHKELFSKKSGANVLVLYGYTAYMERDWQVGQGEYLEITDEDDLFAYKIKYNEKASQMPFWDITQRMIEGQVPYDVLVLGDGRMLPDRLTAADLEPYEMVVVPDCNWMTENQAKVLEEYAKKRPVCIYGDYALNLPQAVDRIKAVGNAVAVSQGADIQRSLMSFQQVIDSVHQNFRLLQCDNDNIYLQQSLTPDGVVIHMLNYALDPVRHKTIPLTYIVEIKCGKYDSIDTFTLDGVPLQYELLPSETTDKVRIRVVDVPCYGAVLFRRRFSI